MRPARCLGICHAKEAEDRADAQRGEGKRIPDEGKDHGKEVEGDEPGPEDDLVEHPLLIIVTQQNPHPPAPPWRQCMWVKPGAGGDAGTWRRRG
eukprot:478777-Rhodomonas_salina.4